MYQPFPQAKGHIQSAAAVPSTVRTAARLMYAGAAVSVLSLIINVLSIGSVRSAVHHARPAMSTTQLHARVAALVVAAVLVSLIGLGLWLWMAAANLRGANWARVTSSVLLGLNTLVVAAGVLQPNALLIKLAAIVVWLVGLAAVVFLWRPESSQFYTRAQAS